MGWGDLLMTRGGKVPAAKWNALVRALRSSLLTSVIGGELSRGSQGTTLVIPGRGTATSAADHPWMPYASSAAKFRVIPSAADNIIPSNWDAEFAVTNADGRWVWLACTMAQEGKVASCEIAEGVAVPATDLPAEDGAIPSPIYVPLFAYDAANGTMTNYYSVVTANLSTQIQITEAGCDKVIRSAVIIQ